MFCGMTQLIMEERRSMFWTFTWQITWLRLKKCQNKIQGLILILCCYRKVRFRRWRWWRITRGCPWRRRSFISLRIWYVDELSIFLDERCLYLIVMSILTNISEKDLESPNNPSTSTTRIQNWFTTQSPPTLGLAPKKTPWEASKPSNQNDPNLTKRKFSSKTSIS